jgi:hypothetical protein
MILCGEREELHTELWWEYLKERCHLEDLFVGGMIILKRIFKTWDEEAWTGFIWLRMETGDRLLLMRY